LIFAIYLRIKSRLVYQKPQLEEGALSTTSDTACAQSSRKPTYSSRLQRQWLIVISAKNIAVILKIRGVINIDYVLIILPVRVLIAWIFWPINIIAIRDCHCITAYLNGTTQITTYLNSSSLLIRELGGFDWWKKNKGQKSCNTVPLKKVTASKG
jgi:hypothetical protein